MPHTLDPVPGRAPYFYALDGVRALCILLVLFDHLPSNGHTISFLEGHLGVDLFFILSGFLITTLLGREQALTGSLDLRAFYWRRFFRIAPVYFSVLAAYVAITHLPGQQAKWIQLKAGLPWFLTMLNEYVREPFPGTVFTHTWSLGVEEKFYLLWPILAFIVARTARARWLLLTAAFTLGAIPPLLGHSRLAQAYFGLLMGCLMALLLASPAATRIRQTVARLPSLVALLIFLSGFYAFHLAKPLIVYFALASILFLTHLIVRPSWLSTALEWKPLTWLGRRSYSMYLVHVLCVNVVEQRLPITSAPRAIAAFLATTALTALTAEVLYRLIESPIRNQGRLWLARHHERPAA